MGIWRTYTVINHSLLWCIYDDLMITYESGVGRNYKNRRRWPMFPLSSGWSSFPHASQLHYFCVDRWIYLLNMVQIKLSLALILTAQAATAIVTVVALPVPTGPAAAVASTAPHTRPKLQSIIPTDSHPSCSSSSDSHSFSSSSGSHNVSPGPSSGFHTYASDSSASNSPHTYVSPVPPKKKH